MADIVEIILKLSQVRQFVAGAKQASGATADIGKSAEKSGKQAHTGWKGMAKWAGGAAALYGAQKYIRGAVDETEQLAKNTIALQRVTALDAKTASEWVGVLKERNISTTTFQVGMKTLAKQMEHSRTGTIAATKATADLRKQYAFVAAQGGKDAPKALGKLQTQIDRATASGVKSRKVFADMGISMSAIKRGDTSEVLLQTADALTKMKTPAERVTAVQTLLGRGGLKLLPVLMKGRKGIEELLGVQERYGNYLDGTGIKSMKDLIERQREMHAASEGVKIQLGIALLPVLLQVSKVLVAMARFLAPLTKNALLFKAAIVAITVAFVFYKSVMLVAAIAQNVFNASLGVTAFLIAAIPLLLAALVIGFIILYKRVGWFREAVNATWAFVKKAFAAMLVAFQTVFNWVKDHWKLLGAILLGPIGIAVYAIVKNFDKIRAAVQWVIDKVKQLAHLLGSIGGLVKHLPGGGLVKKGLHAVGLQHGGTVTRAGSAVVGERGPELLSLPTGARVTPLQGVGQLAGAGMSGEVIIPVYLDGREITRSVARVTSDKKARR